jgi:hypothetical protein
MRFNPPPNWPPFPPDWRPGPDWQPDPSWPPPPPGWALWVDDQYRSAPTEAALPQRSGTRKWWIIGGAVLGIVALVAGGTVVAMKSVRDDTASPSATPTTFNGLTIVPTHPPEPTDFNTWTRVGSVDATFSNNGRTVRLETGTPATDRAGLIQPGDPACSLRFTGRVRSAAGGYAVGLTPEAGPGTDTGPMPAAPDNDWHTIDVTITKAGEVSVDLDGKAALQRTTKPGCGRPAISVSSGATEFADVLVGQVSA